MVRSEFKYTVWIGWLTGTIFLNRPWGRSNYSWLSFYTIYALLFNSFTVILWATFSFRAIEYLQCKSLTSKILNFTLLLGSLLFGAIIKLFFFVRAKSIAKFVDGIRERKEGNTNLAPDLQSLWKRCKILVCVISIYQTGGAVMLPLSVWHIMPNASFGFISSPYYHITLCLFASFPTMTCIQVACVYVVISTFSILLEYEKFFADLKEQVKIKVSLSYNNPLSVQVSSTAMPTPLVPDSSFTPEPIVKFSAIQETSLEKQFKELSRQEILTNINRIKNLCSQYDSSVSPLFLVLIVRCVFSLIHSADAILFESEDLHDDFMKFKKYFAWMHLFFEISQLCLIFVGNIFHKKVAMYKEQFADSIFVLKQSEAKFELQEIWQLVRDWNWQVTAWGIYTVDKPVFAGVVSAMMTYVVILFQVNLSDPGVPANSNCTLPKFS